MGLQVNVYRAAGTDCSNNGISARFDRVCVVNIEGPFKPTEDCPGVLLMDGPATRGEGNPILIPVDGDCDGYLMFGGNFGFSSDSRFGQAVKEISPGFTGAVMFHDRIER